jgi:hypothetical protein
MATKKDYRIKLAEREYTIHIEYHALQLRLQVWVNDTLVHNGMWANPRNAVAFNVDGQEISVVCISPLPNVEFDIALGNTSVVTGRQIAQLVDGTISGKIPASLKGGFMTSVLGTAPKPVSTVSPATPTVQQTSLTQELEKIAALLEKGLIDEEEFKALKKKIIDKM